MSNDDFILESSPVAGRRLRCTFTSSGDRLAHFVEIVADDEARRVLSSVEGRGDEHWPTSPPWQEVHEHRQADGSSALMLVGRAGKSHWSMSVTAEPERGNLLFDVACRLRETPEFLGCTYRDYGGVYRDGDAPPIRITAATFGDTPNQPTIEPAMQNIVIRVSHFASPPCTARWAYRIAPSEGG